MELLERESQQRLLDDTLIQTSGGKGRIALISGEAGIGKTAIVQDFVQKYGRGHRVFWGACDPLFTPRSLGPLYDIATKGYAEKVCKEGFQPLKEVMQSFVANGGQIWACGACAKPRGISESDMVNGAKIVSAVSVVEWLASGASSLSFQGKSFAQGGPHGVHHDSSWPIRPKESFSRSIRKT